MEVHTSRECIWLYVSNSYLSVSKTIPIPTIQNPYLLTLRSCSKTSFQLRLSLYCFICLINKPINHYNNENNNNMKTSSTTFLFFSSLAATFVADAVALYLNGAVQAAASDEFYNLDSHTSGTDSYAALSDDSSYTYQFQMNLSSPLVITSDGEPRIDKCIGWDSSVSPTNYTWYGISFQLPDDANGRGGYWNIALAQPLKDDGYVQMFNDTAVEVAKYNFTTTSDRPVIRARINNGLFWDTFTFDFADGSNYTEQKSEQLVTCIVSKGADGTDYISVVRPAMTLSLERLSAPVPHDPSSSSMNGSFFAVITLASSYFLQLVL